MVAMTERNRAVVLATSSRWPHSSTIRNMRVQGLSYPRLASPRQQEQKKAAQGELQGGPRWRKKNSNGEGLAGGGGGEKHGWPKIGGRRSASEEKGEGKREGRER
ncbi:hypothetical protein V6N13_028621 [Hibiscus sabdariffa]